MNNFCKIIIWGHKLHSHTHSYIHAGYYRAFKSLGYDVYWFDNNDDTQNFDFSNSLFLTEGNVEKNIPIRDDCKYVMSYADRKGKILPRYKMENTLTISTRPLDEQENLIKDLPEIEKIDETTFVRSNLNISDKEAVRWYKNSFATLFQPWATDLLPDEIEPYQKVQRDNVIYYIGTIHSDLRDIIQPFIDAAFQSGVQFKLSSSAWTSKRYFKGDILKEIREDIFKNVPLIKKSFLAPALQPTVQTLGGKRGYIPCRVLKNISYGRLASTNSKWVHDFFGGKIPYNDNTHQLFFDAQEMERIITERDMNELINYVKNKHTYINRVNAIMNLV